MSKISKEVALTLNNKTIYDTVACLLDSAGKEWFNTIKETYEEYNIDHDIYDVVFTVVIEKERYSGGNIELYVGDLLDINTEKAIDGAIVISNYMTKKDPKLTIYAYNEDDEEDREIILWIEI